MPASLAVSALAAQLDQSGYWLERGDFVTTDGREVQALGALGFPRDWPGVYNTSAALKALVGKKGRCAAKQVVVLGLPAAEQYKLVDGLDFQPLQSFANAELAEQRAQLPICRGWAVLELLDAPNGTAFVAERYWWNLLSDGTWVDFTPRPPGWDTLLLALPLTEASKCKSPLTAEAQELSARLFAQRFQTPRDTSSASGSLATAVALTPSQTPAPAQAPANAASSVAVRAAVEREAGAGADAAGHGAGGGNGGAALAAAQAEADEACAELRRLESLAAGLRARLAGEPPQSVRWNPTSGTAGLRPGALAAIHGLREAADLNSQEVTVLSWEERRGRWRVRLRTGEVRAVLPANLELLDEVKDQPELSTFGCEVIGQIPTQQGDAQYHLWPLVYSGIIRVRVPDRLLARLNTQFDELYANARASSHAPYLQGEMKEGRQLTVRHPDEEYVALLLACSEKLSKALVREEAQDFRYQLDTVWTVHQLAGDYNPVHFHNNARSHFGFSSFLHLQLPPQLNIGQAWVPKCGGHGYHDGMTSFIWRTDSGLSREHLENPGVLECELLEGYLYVFPQWVQHFVWPFRGEGERRTVAANISLLGASDRTGLQPAGGGAGLYR